MLDKIAAITHSNYAPSVRQIFNIEELAALSSHYESIYRILFLPSFHPEACLTVGVKAGVSFLQLITAQTNLWQYAHYLRERAKISRRTAIAPDTPQLWVETQTAAAEFTSLFLAQMNQLRPAHLLNEKNIMLDGLSARIELQDPTGTQHQFSVDYSTKKTEQAQFILALYTLATKVLKEEPSLRILENLYGYLGLGLPAKKIEGPLCCARIFGRLSSSQDTELTNFLNDLPLGLPLLMDLSNFDGMGSLLHPVFQEFLNKRAHHRTAWLASRGAHPHLEAIGVPATAIFTDWNTAIAWACKNERY